MGSPTPVTILIIDDEQRNRRLLEVFTQAEGYASLHAADGAEGIALARERRPDLILLDLMMPGIDGFQVARMLKADAATRDIPLVVVSSLDDPAARKRMREAGADDMLVKPVDRWLLSESIGRLLVARDAKDAGHG